MRSNLAARLMMAVSLLAAGAMMARQVADQTRRVPQFENDDVKVWRSVIAGNQPLAMHRHDHPRVIVPLVGGTLKVVRESGGSQTVAWEVGKAYWLAADPPDARHADVNEGDKPIEVIVVELKKAK